MAEARSPVQISARFASSVGLKRDLNEDSILAQFPVYVVADGMGGHSAGDKASQMVIAGLQPLVGRPDVTVGEVKMLLDSIQRQVAQLSDQTETGAGSTLSGVIATATEEGSLQWLVLNIGDSRTYRLLDNQIQRLTVDHSVVQEMLDAGEITESEAADHPQGNVITRALGDGYSQVDMWTSPIVPGERILIVSDGALEGSTDQEVAGVSFAYEDGKDAARAIVERALASGGSDNISAILVDVFAPVTATQFPPLLAVSAGEGSDLDVYDDTTL